jgi:hypothetical protein
MSHVLLWHLVLVTVLALPVWAQEPHEEAGTLAQRNRNPFAYSASLPATLSLGFGVGPRRETEPTLNFQPRIPPGGTDDWRFLPRSNVSILHTHEPEKTGLGDIDVSLFLSPARTSGWVWGRRSHRSIPDRDGPFARHGKVVDRADGGTHARGCERGSTASWPAISGPSRALAIAMT